MTTVRKSALVSVLLNWRPSQTRTTFPQLKTRSAYLPCVREERTLLALDRESDSDGEHKDEEQDSELGDKDEGPQSALVLVEAQGLEVPPYAGGTKHGELGPHAEEGEEVGVGVVETQLHEHRSRLQVQPTLLLQFIHQLHHHVSGGWKVTHNVYR